MSTKTDEDDDNEECEECGGPVIYTGGCVKCLECGWPWKCG